MSGTQPQHHEDEVEHESHGHSTAAWTAVGVCMLGFLVMCIAVVVPSVWMFVVGAVIVVVGGILGKLLGAMGFGADNARSVR